MIFSFSTSFVFTFWWYNKNKLNLVYHIYICYCKKCCKRAEEEINNWAVNKAWDHTLNCEAKQRYVSAIYLTYK